MRVLHVTPIFETSEGGMPRFVAGIVSALVRYGVEVTVAATVPTDTTDLKLVQMDPRVDCQRQLNSEHFRQSKIDPITVDGCFAVIAL